MAQPQQQYSMPPQSSNSPGAPQQYPLPPNKRQRLSPNPPSQPGSPYVQSPYSGMNSNTAGPPSAGASPHFQNIQLPPNVYNTPYSNGHTTPTLSLPQPQSIQQNPPLQSSLNFPGQNQPSQQPNFNNYSMAQQGPGTMGPPSKPIEKSKEDGMDVMDVLGGTGIDLREEEQYTFQMYNTSFNSQLSGSQSGTISSGNSFTQFPPADERSFYGAGPANAAPEKANSKSQDEYHKKVADKAWHDAARNLALSRQKELDNPFLQVGLVHTRVSKIARDNGLMLNTDQKGMMGTMKLPENFQHREVRVQTAVGPGIALTATNGNFLPLDSMLVDQLALLSIATKHRLRSLIEDAAKLSKGRRTGSHGIIPDEWNDAAAPSNPDSSSLVPEGGFRSGWESAVSPHSNPLKRSFSSANKIPTPVSDGGKTSASSIKITNEVVFALRSTATKERDYEEARLRKRMKRSTGGDGTPRQGSVPGTPASNSVAPEAPEKAPTKKEQKKKAEAKVNEAASHAAANVTTAQFLGGGGGIFGKKKKYSWMTGGAGGAGGSASGTSTPGRITTQGLPGTPGGAVGNAAPEKLTAEGARRLGTWREDREKGVGIQMRDWVTVLEEDGHEKKALQKAYMSLDLSGP